MILQIAGSKRWRLFKGQRTLPLAEERFRLEGDYVSTDVEEVVLYPGDSLYLPRGVIHEPVAETYSVHLSIGIHTHRYYDLAHIALQLLAAREGSPLRRALPRGDFTGELAFDAGFLNGLLETELLKEARTILRRRFLDNTAVDLEGRLMEIYNGPCIYPTLRYGRREGVVLEIGETPTGFRIAVGEQSIHVPRALQEAIQYIYYADRPFMVSELPGDNINDAHLALCLALREIGVLKIVDEVPQ